MSAHAADTSSQERGPVDYGRLVSVWQAHQPVDEAAALSSLEAPQPAWQLSLDGYIVAANVAAIWLWQVKSSGGLWQRLDRVSVTRLLDATAVLEAHIFDDVYARSAWRIPASENAPFWSAQARVYRAGDGRNDSPFVRAMLMDEERRRIYEHMAGSSADLQADVWSYPLRLMPPSDPAFVPAKLLDFQVTVHPVDRKGEPLGFVTSFFRVGATDNLIGQLLRDWSRAAPDLPYVFHSNLKRRLPLVGPPEAAPAAVVEGPPPVTLYAGEPLETERAGALLTAAQIGFRVVPQQDGQPVWAEFGDLRYEGVDGVEALVGTLSAMQRAFLEHAPKRPRHAPDWPEGSREACRCTEN